MFHVNEGGHAAHFLGLGDDVLGQGGLARTFGAIDFGDAASGDAADAQGDVEGDGAGGDSFNVQVSGLPQFHNSPFSEAFFDS
jgi:hypothetical protein